MQIPKTLVLGATGRIGQILRECWGEGADQVLWQTRGQTRTGRDGAGWITLDPLAQPRALARAARGCTAILCLAGVVPGRGSGQMLSDNIALAEAAIRASFASCAKTGSKSGLTAAPAVFLTSSAAVYGDQTGQVTEAAPLAPINDYGRAKAQMELRGTALAAELGVAVTALRIGNIAGIDAILGGWRPGFRLDQFCDGRTPRRSYIGVQSLAQVLGDLLAARPSTPSSELPQALNIASPGLIEMGALLDAAGLAWDPQPAPETAIGELSLSTAALARVIPLPDPVRAETLVAQWRAVRDKIA